MRPVFVVDPRKCIGCMACVAACAVENGLPFPVWHTEPLGWPQTVKGRTWVMWVEDEEGPSRTFLPYLCQHCEDPPCYHVCPTQATIRTEEGVVLIDKAKCIGCGYCIVACPYGARYPIKAGEFAKAEKAVGLDRAVSRLREKNLDVEPFETPEANRWAAVERAVDKCTLCYHRKENGGRWIPACVEVCPTKARAFGDLDDPNDPVAELVRKGKARHIRPDLGTGGLVYFVRG